jgi:hypothetical protein
MYGFGRASDVDLGHRGRNDGKAEVSQADSGLAWLISTQVLAPQAGMMSTEATGS